MHNTRSTALSYRIMIRTHIARGTLEIMYATKVSARSHRGHFVRQCNARKRRHAAVRLRRSPEGTNASGVNCVTDVIFVVKVEKKVQKLQYRHYYKVDKNMFYEMPINVLLLKI